MRLIFEDTVNVEEDEYKYSIEIESIIFNMDDLDESLVSETASELAEKIFKKMRENEKFIKDSLDIDYFEVREVDFKSPILLLEFECDKLIDDDTLNSVLGRYTSVEHEESFSVDGKMSKIKIKPVRGELKIYFSA